MANCQCLEGKHSLPCVQCQLEADIYWDSIPYSGLPQGSPLPEPTTPEGSEVWQKNNTEGVGIPLSS